MVRANLRTVQATPAGKTDVTDLMPSFEHFYESTSRRLFTALCLVTGNRDEAEEIAQEAFVRVFERWNCVGELDDSTGSCSGSR